MREIKFRGKCVDNGEWVEGYYGKKGIEGYTQHCIMQSVLSNQPFTYFYFSDCEVIPETISQYTGLHDKNGKEIYEGDVCNCFEYECSGKVEWDNDDGGFYFYIFEDNGMYDIEHLCDYIHELEVIGNIFDNPEEIESEE